MDRAPAHPLTPRTRPAKRRLAGSLAFTPRARMTRHGKSPREATKPRETHTTRLLRPTTQRTPTVAPALRLHDQAQSRQNNQRPRRINSRQARTRTGTTSNQRKSSSAPRGSNPHGATNPSTRSNGSSPNAQARTRPWTIEPAPGRQRPEPRFFDPDPPRPAMSHPRATLIW